MRMGLIDAVLNRKQQVPPTAVPRFAPASLDTVGKEMYSQYRAGYESNPFVFRAVNIRSNAVASVPFLIFDTHDNEIMSRDHPLRKLLARPNPKMSWTEFVRISETYLGINGNVFIYPIKTTFDGVKELWPISPDRVTPQRSNDVFEPVSAWTINTGNGTITVKPDELIHIKLNNSSDELFGVSPMYVAKRAIDMQNAASRWNTSALSNGARPSLHLKMHRVLTKIQKRELKEEVRGKYQGQDNTGNVMITGDDMDVTPLGFTAVEMDFANGMVMNAREISVAYEVPSELIGDVSNKTYANAAEAGRQFAVNCVLPLLNMLYGALDSFLTPMYKDVGRISYDIAKVQDLAGDQTNLYTSVTNADFLTVNEKREIFGYDDVGSEGDIILTNMSRVPLSEAVTEITVPPMKDPAQDEGTDGDV